MDLFNFQCITLSKTELKNGTFIRAVNKNGLIGFITYSKKNNLDIMNYAEISGYYKNSKRNYFITKEINIIDRFPEIRNSFYKLSSAMLFLEITEKAKMGFELLLHSLKKLEKSSYRMTIIYFLSHFLILNGIFDKNRYSPKELSIIKFLLQNKTATTPKIIIDNRYFKQILEKLSHDTQVYLNTKLKSIEFFK